MPQGPMPPPPRPPCGVATLHHSHPPQAGKPQSSTLHGEGNPRSEVTPDQPTAKLLRRAEETSSQPSASTKRISFRGSATRDGGSMNRPIAASTAETTK